MTDHAAERYRQRVRGTLDACAEITARVAEAWAQDRMEQRGRGSVDVYDGTLLFACRHDAPRGELIVVTVWENSETARVPRRFTDALREPRRKSS